MTKPATTGHTCLGVPSLKSKAACPQWRSRGARCGCGCPTSEGICDCTTWLLEPVTFQGGRSLP
eukprot:678037-Amphidinium_carterae.1